MSCTHTRAAQVAWSLASKSGELLEYPKLAPSESFTVIDLMVSHQVHAGFFVGVRSCGLTIDHRDAGVYYHIMHHLCELHFDAPYPIHRSGPRTFQIRSGDFSQSHVFKALIERATKSEAEQTDLVNHLGSLLFNDYITQLLPLIKSWAGNSKR